MKVIAFCNQKGGASKTTDTINFAIQLSKTNKVLVIDLDQQGNSTKSISSHDIAESDFFGTKNISQIFYEDLLGTKTELKNLITQWGDIYLIASSRKLVEVSSYINQKQYNGNLMLYEKIQELKKDNFFDYVFIDTNPAVDNVFMNALYACDELIIPCKPEQYHIDGVLAVLEIFNNVNKNCPLLNIEPKKLNGIIFNIVNKRAKFHTDTMEEMSQYLKNNNIYCYQNFIRNNIKISESQGKNLSVEEFAKNANGTKDFQAVIKEFLEREKEA